MTSRLLNQDEAFRFAEGFSDRNKSYFLGMGLARAVLMDEALSPDSEFDLIFFTRILKQLYERRTALVEVLSGRADGVRMIPEEI